MSASDFATEVLAAQEIESLASCLARGQAPDTYQDIVVKIRAHVVKLSPARMTVFTEQVLALGVTLFPPPPKPKVELKPVTKAETK